MAIYHLTLDYGSKAKGDLAVDKFDYIMRLGRFAKKYDGPLVYSANGNMPSWAANDPRQFWLADDEFERSNGALYHEIEFALPLELSPDERISAAHEFATKIIGTVHPYSLAIHGNRGNPHVHLMFSGRKLDGIERAPEQFFKRANSKNPERGGCAKVAAEERGRDWVKQVRQDWQDVANRRLEAAGETARIDCRSHADRGLIDAPGVHLGRHVARLERRGKVTRRGLKNREAKYLNASLREVETKIREISHEQHHRRNGKTHNPYRPGKRAAAERTFTAWKNGAENRPGLRVSKHAKPQRMPPLRQQGAGDGFEAAGDAVLQRPLSRPGSGNHRVHGLYAGELACIDDASRRQAYKAKLLEQAYARQISSALAGRLAYVDRQSDHLAIRLKDGGQVVDHGDRISAARGNSVEIAAMIELAIAKGWTSVEPRGPEEFKLAAWLQARRAGLTVRNYTPPAHLANQFQSAAQQQESNEMSQQNSTVNTLPRIANQPTTTPAAPLSPSRWKRPLELALARLQDQHRMLYDRYHNTTDLNLKELERKLVAEHADEAYRKALSEYQHARQATKDANLLTRKHRERKQADTWNLLKKEYARLLTLPVIAQALTLAIQKNTERAALGSEIQQIYHAIEFIKVRLRDLERGRDPEDEFRHAWEHRNRYPLNRWQKEVLAPVFEADEEEQRRQTEAQHQAQILQKQHEKEARLQQQAHAQQRADQLQEQLETLDAHQEQDREQIEVELAYYQAIADGHDDNEARDLANNANAKNRHQRPRPF